MRQLELKWFGIWAGITRYGTQKQCRGLRLGCRIGAVIVLLDIDVIPQRFNSLAEHVRESFDISVKFGISRKVNLQYPIPAYQVLFWRTD